MYFGKKTVKKGVHGAGRLGLKMNAKSKMLGRKFAGVASRPIMPSPGIRPGGPVATLPYKRARMM